MPVEVKNPNAEFFKGLSDQLLSNFLTNDEIKLIKSSNDPDLDVSNILDRNQSQIDFFKLFLQYGDFIPVEQLRLWTRDYRTRLDQEGHEDRVGRTKKIDLIQCCYFSIEEIKEFLDGNGIDIDGSDKGIRIYMGINLDSGTDYKMTCILVPTVTTGGIPTDDVESSSPRFVSIAGGAYNHGELCPRNCEGALFV
jgi:hypothetical protein